MHSAASWLRPSCWGNWLQIATADGSSNEPREDGETGERRLLRRREKTEAPIQRRSKRLVPGQRGPTPLGQQRPSVSQPGGNRLHAHDPDASGGQFNRERVAVQTVADFADRCRVLVGQGEDIGGSVCTFDEELNRLVEQGFAGGGLPRLTFGWGRRECGQSVYPFAFDTKCLATRRDDVHAGRASDDALCKFGRPVNHVLAVVEHDERSLVAQCVNKGLLRVAGRERKSDGGSDGPWNQLSSFERCELDEVSGRGL